MWRSGYGVNEKAPQAVVVVLQSCGKKEPRKIEKNEQARLGVNLKPGEQNGLLADSQRGSGPKEKADAGIVKEEEKSARV